MRLLLATSVLFGLFTVAAVAGDGVETPLPPAKSVPAIEPAPAPVERIVAIPLFVRSVKVRETIAPRRYEYRVVVGAADGLGFRPFARLFRGGCAACGF